MTVTDLATTTPAASAPQTVYGFIDRIKPQIAQALPRGMDVDRVTRLALTVIRQSDMQAQKTRRPQDSLANCTPESFAGALLTSAALGLEPGVNGEAWLVPYKGECTLIIGYQGYVKLFWQHPLAKHIDARTVYEKDSFDYARGLAQFLRHKPATGDRGQVTHYYAVAELSTGANAFEVLTAGEVKALRGGKVGPNGGIPDPMRWMERKTALRQLVKLLPKSTNLSAALAVDEQRGSTLAQENVASAIANGETFPALPPSVGDEAVERAEANEAARVTDTEILGDGCPGCGKATVCDPSTSCPANQPAEQGTLA